MVTSDVPLSETLAFVQSHLPAAPARILEVGCGDGALAERLLETGHQVIAVDASAEAVDKARRRGVDVRLARWPDFADEPFDAVLFTRSLHHIAPLPPALVRSKELLKPHGKVLVEDFAFDEVESLAAEWLYQTLSILDAAQLLRRDGPGFATRFLQAKGALAAWRAEHDHHLHSAPTMLAGLREHFGEVRTATAPYLYRYVCGILEENEAGYEIGLRVLELEKRFADIGKWVFIGRRWVATNLI